MPLQHFTIEIETATGTPLWGADLIRNCLSLPASGRVLRVQVCPATAGQPPQKTTAGNLSMVALADIQRQIDTMKAELHDLQQLAALDTWNGYPRLEPQNGER